MSKSLLYRLFKSGTIPKSARSQILKEGVLLQDEGIRGSITFKNFRAPGRYHGWKRSWFSGSVVLTRKHFLAFGFSSSLIGIAWDDARIKELDCSIEKKNTLCIRYDASTFNEDWSGTIECRYSSPHAHEFLRIIKQKIVRRRA